MRINKDLIRRLGNMLTAKQYSVRDMQFLLQHRHGFAVSIDYVWKRRKDYLKELKKNKAKSRR